METHHNLNAQEVLEKHSSLKPKTALVISLSEDNKITLDMSHPCTIPDICVLAKFLEVHMNRYVAEGMGYK